MGQYTGRAEGGVATLSGKRLGGGVAIGSHSFGVGHLASIQPPGWTQGIRGFGPVATMGQDHRIHSTPAVQAACARPIAFVGLVPFHRQEKTLTAWAGRGHAVTSRSFSSCWRVVARLPPERRPALPRCCGHHVRRSRGRSSRPSAPAR